MANSSFEDRVLAADATANLEKAEQHQNFSEPHNQGSWILQDAHPVQRRASEAGQEMWDTYDAGDIDFEIAVDVTETADQAMKWQYKHNLEDNQTWNSEDKVGTAIVFRR